MSKQEWKETGSSLGHAFETFGKTFVRSAKTTGKNVSDWADGKEPQQQPENSSVYSDGSWRQTGKELGSAFLSVGKSIIHSIEEGADSVCEGDTQQNQTTDEQRANDGAQ